MTSRIYADLNECRVDLFVSLSDLDAYVADVWNVVSNEPFIVRLSSLSDYPHGVRPVLEVFATHPYGKKVRSLINYRMQNLLIGC